MTILRRILSYGRKVFDLPRLLAGVTDTRVKPRIPTATVVQSVVVMFLSRLRSLNALEHARSSPLWKRWGGSPPPSADSLGRICAQLDLGSIREVNRCLYSQLKRKKGFGPPCHGQVALVLDGHQSNSSRKRRCGGCLERRVKTKNGEITEFYHSNVTALLVGRDFQLLIDAEPQRPGENELGAARRLFDRVVKAYPRAFDVVVGDALYTDAGFYEHVRSKGKQVLTVLKENQPTLLREAQELLGQTGSRVSGSRRYRKEVWDSEGFSFARSDLSLRVVRSLETRQVRRQLTSQEEEVVSDWYWVTTLPQAQVDRLDVVSIGHSRWTIENQGFNECVNRWHADHVYKHDSTAILAFWLLCMSAFNLFQAFFTRNLKPELRRQVTRQHIAELIRAELYRGIAAFSPQPP